MSTQILVEQIHFREHIMDINLAHSWPPLKSIENVVVQLLISISFSHNWW